MFTRARIPFVRMPLARAIVASASRTLVSKAPISAGKSTIQRFAFARPTSTIRQYSVLSLSEAKLYNYKDIKQLVENPEAQPKTVLIDVREPVEFQEGHIPGAHNVPFKSSPGALDLPAEDFEEIFGFSKPTKDQELVFYCLGGVRSTAAEELANAFGYSKRGNYVGSWEDWVAHQTAPETAPQ